MTLLVALGAASAVVRAPANRPIAAAAPSKLRRFMLRLLPVRDVAGVAPDDDGQPSAGNSRLCSFKAPNSARQRLLGQPERLSGGKLIRSRRPPGTHSPGRSVRRAFQDSVTGHLRPSERAGGQWSARSLAKTAVFKIHRIWLSYLMR